MTNRFDVLTQQLFQKNIDDCSVEELQGLANEHPYFAPAQYALLLKLKEADQNGYQAQLQKAILYYHDPLVFDQFINADTNVFDFIETEKEVETNDVAGLGKEPEIERNEEVINTEEEVPLPENFIEPENTEVTPEIIASPEVAANETSEVEVAGEEQAITSPEPEKEKVDEIRVKEITIQEPVNISKEENSITEPLAFEPYHTVDYFASQGIKLSQEEATKDKFGKQLKSFTEWLKTMKRLPVTEQAKPLDVHSEQNVENLAAHSVEKEEVYTETMAEVWLRQGNKEKAIEIYNKLSLLNPSKRAYFAAKIDSLK